MFKLLVVPVSVGILVFLVIYFIAPAIVPESEIVAHVARFTLNFSNANFESMPAILVSFIASLNLLLVAVVVGSLLTLMILFMVIIAGIFIGIIKWVVSCLQKDRGKEVVKDMSPIDLDSKYMKPGAGEKILGRGLDSIDKE